MLLADRLLLLLEQFLLLLAVRLMLLLEQFPQLAVSQPDLDHDDDNGNQEKETPTIDRAISGNVKYSITDRPNLRLRSRAATTPSHSLSLAGNWMQDGCIEKTDSQFACMPGIAAGTEDGGTRFLTDGSHPLSPMWQDAPPDHADLVVRHHIGGDRIL